MYTAQKLFTSKACSVFSLLQPLELCVETLSVSGTEQTCDLTRIM